MKEEAETADPDRTFGSSCSQTQDKKSRNICTAKITQRSIYSRQAPSAVSRIWKALQSLGEVAPAAAAVEEPAAVADAAPVAEPSETAPIAEPEAGETTQPEPVVAETPEPAVVTPVAPQAPDVAPEAAPAKKTATREKKAPKTATEPGAPREGSKTSRVIAMLKREGGTTLEEIMSAMGWQKHTTRAMLSAGGSLTKNHGLVITSEKVGDKRTYSIKS
jgi:outer membrane biosynthesis protein TonB